MLCFKNHVYSICSTKFRDLKIAANQFHDSKNVVIQYIHHNSMI